MTNIHKECPRGSSYPAINKVYYYENYIHPTFRFHPD